MDNHNHQEEKLKNNIMSNNLQINGDLLERLNYNLIHNRIPNYELIWDKFVSVNFILNADNEKLKKLISEYNYTCLESLICMNIIGEKDYTNIFAVKDSSELTDSQMLSNYISFINDFFIFEAHLGRIYETMKRTWELLKMKEDDNLKEFYCHRHNVLHSHKLPLQFHNKFIAIPELQAQGSENGWSDKGKFAWEDFLSDNNYVQALNDYFDDTIDRLVNVLNVSFSAIMSKLKGLIVDWKVKDIQIVNPHFDPFSGTTMTINFTYPYIKL
jgi:hypothetical protein